MFVVPTLSNVYHHRCVQEQISAPHLIPDNLLTLLAKGILTVGDMDAIRLWDAAKAIALSSADHPNWKGIVFVPANIKFQYKYIKKELG